VLVPLTVDHGAPALDTSTRVLLSGDEPTDVPVTIPPF
jgi:hypothetical protein